MAQITLTFNLPYFDVQLDHFETAVTVVQWHYSTGSVHGHGRCTSFLLHADACHAGTTGVLLRAAHIRELYYETEPFLKVTTRAEARKGTVFSSGIPHRK